MYRSLQKTLMFAVLLATTTVVLASSSDNSDNTDNVVPCRLWMAPSHLSTGSDTVFGLFAGEQGFEKDDLIPSHEIAVPFYDFSKTPVAKRFPHLVEYLERTMWLSDYAGSKFESNSSTSVFIPGIGFWANQHTGMYNVDWLQSSILLREADEMVLSQQGVAHPSRGAITPYYNATLQATKRIPPGMELFANHGDSVEYMEDDIYQDRLTMWDYEHADLLLNKIITFMDRFGTEMSESLQHKLLDFMLNNILQGAEKKRSRVIRSLIPARTDLLQAVKDAGGTFLYRNKDMVKSQNWLEEHGLCVDNLRPGKSTIPDAGRGAFANRPVKEGDTISPVPMFAIQDEAVLQLFTETKAIKGEDGNIIEWVIDQDKAAAGSHLLLNYCFGHGESTLLLLPEAPIVNLINHAPTKKQVNAFLQWSKHDHIYNDHFLQDRPLTEWRRNPGLIVMELVATRDIAVGEEILIDYGSSWDEAWNTYKEAFDGAYSSDKVWPMRALDLRSLYKDAPYPVDIQIGQTPYPEGIATVCFVESVEELPDGEPKVNSARLGVRLWLGPKPITKVTGLNMGLCDLMERIEVVDDGMKSYNYTAFMMFNNEKMEIRNIPQQAITLVDRPYSSDIHTKNAFRRWIDIEDHRFPQAWRNLRE